MAKHKEIILQAALKLAATMPYTDIRRHHLVDATGLSAGTVSNEVGTMAKFQRSLMRAAIQSENLPVLALGLARRDSTALKAPADLRERAVAMLNA